MLYANCSVLLFFFFKQKTAYEMRISDWSSDVCSSDLNVTVNLNGFYSKLKANNFNRNYMMWATHFVHGATNLQPGYVVNNNTLTNAEIGRASGRERVCQYV